MEELKQEFEEKFLNGIKVEEWTNYFEICSEELQELWMWIEAKVSQVEKPVIRFAKPTINEFKFIRWLSDQRFYSAREETPIDKYILESYVDAVEQFINYPESEATKGLLEIATQTVKKYLKQNI